MNEFDQRWQAGAARAREAEPRNDAEAPPGFTQRVLARAARTPRSIEWLMESLWTRFTLRTLVFAAGILLAVLAFDDFTQANGASFVPELEPSPTVLPWTP